ncbi:hypothetical protein H4687_008890 [Streptomyces stelliscabiei]|uniref:Uncharacterized protein n=1 Tax=Streptomyces stelliscabiei TaxID=146820 RepID=A0A8I0PHQ9_9ACTN|nr:hypothetical protein [Streptomyces stelliscabiei]
MAALPVVDLGEFGGELPGQARVIEKGKRNVACPTSHRVARGGHAGHPMGEGDHALCLVAVELPGRDRPAEGVAVPGCRCSFPDHRPGCAHGRRRRPAAASRCGGGLRPVMHPEPSRPGQAGDLGLACGLGWGRTRRAPDARRARSPPPTDTPANVTSTAPTRSSRPRTINSDSPTLSAPPHGPTTAGRCSSCTPNASPGRRPPAPPARPSAPSRQSVLSTSSSTALTSSAARS